MEIWNKMSKDDFDIFVLLIKSSKCLKHAVNYYKYMALNAESGALILALSGNKKLKAQHSHDNVEVRK